jgi:hypothetical protein
VARAFASLSVEAGLHDDDGASTRRPETFFGSACRASFLKLCPRGLGTFDGQAACSEHRDAGGGSGARRARCDERRVLPIGERYRPWARACIVLSPATAATPDPAGAHAGPQELWAPFNLPRISGVHGGRKHARSATRLRISAPPVRVPAAAWRPPPSSSGSCLRPVPAVTVNARSPVSKRIARSRRVETPRGVPLASALAAPWTLPSTSPQVSADPPRATACFPASGANSTARSPCRLLA